MATNFFLANKDKDISNIDVIVRFKGKRFKRTSGESINTNYWYNGWCREVREYPRGKAVNLKLKKIEKACERVCDKFIEQVDIPTKEEFWREVDVVLTGEVTRVLSFTDYFSKYKERIRNDVTEGTIKGYESILGVLLSYEKGMRVKLYFRDINMDFYNSLKKWMQEKGYSENYFGAAIKKIKKVYKEARDTDKLHQFHETNNTNFKCVENTADTVYLTEDELLKIYQLRFTPELIKEYCLKCAKRGDKNYNKLKLSDSDILRKIRCLNIVKNKFLIGCCTALRVSDFNRLEKINLDDRFIRIRTKKTLNPVVIPIHWMLKEILDSGFDLSTKISDQKINEHIKEICELAGINEIIEVTKFEINKKFSVSHPKYLLITNHTARRTGATNMYKAGIPAISIMKITGHKSERDFLKYIKISAEENAEMLSNHPFFKKTT